jgi:hypothetical protein
MHPLHPHPQSTPTPQTPHPPLPRPPLLAVLHRLGNAGRGVAWWFEGGRGLGGGRFGAVMRRGARRAWSGAQSRVVRNPALKTRPPKPPPPKPLPTPTAVCVVQPPPPNPTPPHTNKESKPPPTAERVVQPPHEVVPVVGGEGHEGAAHQDELNLVGGWGWGGGGGGWGWGVEGWVWVWVCFFGVACPLAGEGPPKTQNTSPTQSLRPPPRPSPTPPCPRCGPAASAGPRAPAPLGGGASVF